MRPDRIMRLVISLGSIAAALSAEPAWATRTVVDSGVNVTTQGYCSPSSAGDSTQCSPYSLSGLALPLLVGGTPYNSFYVNSNGTVSLASIETFLAAENADGAPGQANLAAFGVPIFSPFFSDGAGVPSNAFDVDSGFDGNLAADTGLSTSGFVVDWYSCTNPLDCGSKTIELLNSTNYSDDPPNPLLQDNIIAASTLPPGTGTPEDNFNSGRAAIIAGLPFYMMQLTTLADGFQVDYRYSGGALGATGTYGFILPGASLQTTGALQNRTFLFNSLGQLVGGVPEPSTWMSMLLGLGLMGFALRRARPKLQPA
jgi:hypothetical protein